MFYMEKLSKKQLENYNWNMYEINVIFILKHVNIWKIYIYI